jgi:hypothetical protein
LLVWGRHALGDQIAADPSDFEVYFNGTGGLNLSDMGVGDTGGASPNLGRRAVVRFSLNGLAGHTIQSAVINLYIEESRKDQSPDPGVITSSPPFINPGLGDTQIIHIADYVTPSADAYNSPSIGNDPGTIIPAGFQPLTRQVSLDVKAAMQQAINSGFAYVTFRIQTATETDNDGQNDLWFFTSGNALDPAQQPNLVFTQTPEPGSLLLVPLGVGLLSLRRRRSTRRGN